jgi:mono/diheme cytochrome c family protein
MRNFVLGVIVTVLVIIVGGWLYASGGFMKITADESPGQLERRLASTAVDAAVERQAPQITSPIPATDSNLIDGMKLYRSNCAGCHGDMDKKVAEFGRSLYPATPQLIVRPIHDPEWHIFYVVKHGIRWTGMPAWGKTVKDEDLWKVTMFLQRVGNLPPAVQQAIPK